MNGMSRSVVFGSKSYAFARNQICRFCIDIGSSWSWLAVLLHFWVDIGPELGQDFGQVRDFCQVFVPNVGQVFGQDFDQVFSQYIGQAFSQVFG